MYIHVPVFDLSGFTYQIATKFFQHVDQNCINFALKCIQIYKPQGQITPRHTCLISYF